MAATFTQGEPSDTQYLGSALLKDITCINNNNFGDKSDPAGEADGNLENDQINGVTSLKDDAKSKSTTIHYDGLKPLPGTVKRFYYGTTVFLTGGTGFLGKALIEKLLRSCESIKCIYILLRPKKGHGIEQRHKDLLNNLVFDKIRDKWPERLEKIKPIAGEVTLPDMGMSPAFLKVLHEEVDIVIHSAASIRFIEPLALALTLNTLGTKRMLEVCRNMKNLKSLVHVSTAYSNSNILDAEIEEKIYPMTQDPENILQCLAALPQDLLEIIAPRIQGGHPNTYTFTKALAEQVILKFGAGLPICIVRPSIVTPAYKEPSPGWVDNLFGVTGVIMEISRGTIRSGVCRQDGIMDLIPVDLAVNCCITAAWHHTKYTSPEPLVYNCTSGSSNPLTWYQLTKFTVDHARLSPSKYVVMYPNFSYTTSRAVNLFWEMTTHYVPSILLDILMRAQGKKPIMMKLAKRFKMATLTGEYFAWNEFRFSTGNMLTLMKDLEGTSENVEFLCDVKGIDWFPYMGNFLMGIKKYILKDSGDSLAAAKKKVRRLFWAQSLIQLATGYYIIKLLLRLRWKKRF